ncbi:unnamed protein product [Protopolystoma xenopodis]|uniref:Uncharacterized protein n=1 Tax=Protopolystoma xenopodis TaxID=117903 RepID=A0A3S5CFV4_9PLAT|nr:unnamed protein product [Protopolystoma xenopodis]
MSSVEQACSRDMQNGIGDLSGNILCTRFLVKVSFLFVSSLLIVALFLSIHLSSMNARDHRTIIGFQRCQHVVSYFISIPQSLAYQEVV